jgi:hypothetical protein
MLENYRVALPHIFHHSIRRHLFGMAADFLPRILDDDGRIHRSLMKKAKYHPEILENYLKDLLGDIKVSAGLRSHIIPTKIYQGDNLRFSNILEASGQNEHDGMEMYKAVMASSMHFACFPTYAIELEGKTVHCQDGGMIEHPYHVYQTMKHALPEGTDIHMVILSTGREKPAECSATRFNHLGLTGAFHYSNGMPVVTEFTEGGYRENMRHLQRDLGSKLIDIDFDLAPHFASGNIPHMDDATPAVLESYDAIAATEYERNAEKFGRLRALLDLRELARTSPELFVEKSAKTASEPVAEKHEYPAFSLRSLIPSQLMNWMAPPKQVTHEPSVLVVH